MKRIAYLLVALILIIKLTGCETNNSIDDVDIIDTTTISSNHITYKFIHDGDSVFIGGFGYWDFKTIYLMKLEHNGYFNDWTQNYYNWTYDTTKYIKISKNEIKYMRYHKDSIPLDYYGQPLTALRMGFITSNNDLLYGIELLMIIIQNIKMIQ